MKTHPGFTADKSLHQAQQMYASDGQSYLANLRTSTATIVPQDCGPCIWGSKYCCTWSDVWGNWLCGYYSC